MVAKIASQLMNKPKICSLTPEMLAFDGAAVVEVLHVLDGDRATGVVVVSSAEANGVFEFSLVFRTPVKIFR